MPLESLSLLKCLLSSALSSQQKALKSEAAFAGRALAKLVIAITTRNSKRGVQNRTPLTINFLENFPPFFLFKPNTAYSTIFSLKREYPFQSTLPNLTFTIPYVNITKNQNDLWVISRKRLSSLELPYSKKGANDYEAY